MLPSAQFLILARKITMPVQTISFSRPCLESASSLTLPDLKNRDRKDTNWKAAFDWYNKFIAGEDKVDMSCAPCWIKISIILKAAKS